MLEKKISDLCTENLFFLIIGLMFVIRGLFDNKPPSEITFSSTMFSCISVISV